MPWSKLVEGAYTGISYQALYEEVFEQGSLQVELRILLARSHEVGAFIRGTYKPVTAIEELSNRFLRTGCNEVR